MQGRRRNAVQVVAPALARTRRAALIGKPREIQNYNTTLREATTQTACVEGVRAGRCRQRTERGLDAPPSGECRRKWGSRPIPPVLE
jgi:hypothetical protein